MHSNTHVKFSTVVYIFRHKAASAKIGHVVCLSGSSFWDIVHVDEPPSLLRVLTYIGIIRYWYTYSISNRVIF